MQHVASCQKSINELYVDLNIVHRQLLSDFGGANCPSGHPAIIARTRLNQILAETMPSATLPRPMFLASETWSLIMLRFEFYSINSNWYAQALLSLFSPSLLLREEQNFNIKTADNSKVNTTRPSLVKF